MSDTRAPLIKTSTNTKVRKYRDQRYWAQNGHIRVVDERTGKMSVVPLREWLARAKAFSMQLSRDKYAGEREEMVTNLEDMVRTAKEAKAQGDPYNPKDMKSVVNLHSSNRFNMPRRAGEDMPIAAENWTAEFSVGKPATERDTVFPDRIVPATISSTSENGSSQKGRLA